MESLPNVNALTKLLVRIRQYAASIVHLHLRPSGVIYDSAKVSIAEFPLRETGEPIDKQHRNGVRAGAACLSGVNPGKGCARPEPVGRLSPSESVS